jgi:hypothetical protein
MREASFSILERTYIHTGKIKWRYKPPQRTCNDKRKTHDTPFMTSRIKFYIEMYVHATATVLLWHWGKVWGHWLGAMMIVVSAAFFLVTRLKRMKWWSKDCEAYWVTDFHFEAFLEENKSLVRVSFPKRFFKLVFIMNFIFKRQGKTDYTSETQFIRWLPKAKLNN